MESHLTEDVDICINSIDERLTTEPTNPRSEAAQNAIRDLGVKQWDRLMWRAQPAPSQTLPGEGARPENEGKDYSLRYLMHDAKIVFGQNSYQHLTLRTFYREEGKAHFLTYLDAYAALYSSSRSEKMNDRVGHLWCLQHYLRKNKKGMWKHNATKIGDRVFNCTLFMLLQRLAFYSARSKASWFKDLEDELFRLRSEYSIPAAWNIESELEELLTEIRAKRRSVLNSFEDAVKLQWVEQPIPLSQITIRIKNPSAIECIICGDAVSHGVLTQRCNHAYCQECLQAWVYACEPNSHTCPACRTELFAKPEYECKEPAVVMNYAQEMEDLDQWLKQVQYTQNSLKLFTKEMELQQTFAAANDC